MRLLGSLSALAFQNNRQSLDGKNDGGDSHGPGGAGGGGLGGRGNGMTAPVAAEAAARRWVGAVVGEAKVPPAALEALAAEAAVAAKARPVGREAPAQSF